MAGVFSRPGRFRLAPNVHAGEETNNELVEQDCLVHSAHYDRQLWKNKSPGNFVITTGER